MDQGSDNQPTCNTVGDKKEEGALTDGSTTDALNPQEFVSQLFKSIVSSKSPPLDHQVPAAVPSTNVSTTTEAHPVVAPTTQVASIQQQPATNTSLPSLLVAASSSLQQSSSIPNTENGKEVELALGQDALAPSADWQLPSLTDLLVGGGPPLPEGVPPLVDDGPSLVTIQSSVAMTKPPLGEVSPPIPVTAPPPAGALLPSSVSAKPTAGNPSILAPPKQQIVSQVVSMEGTQPTSSTSHEPAPLQSSSSTSIVLPPPTCIPKLPTQQQPSSGQFRTSYPTQTILQGSANQSSGSNVMIRAVGIPLAAGVPSTQPTGSSLQAGTPSTQPTGSSLPANVPSTQPAGSSLQAGTPSTQPTGSLLQANVPSVQPTRSLLQANVSSTQPTGSSLQAGAPSTQPAGPLLQAGTPSTKPTGSLLQANVPSVQPTRSLLQANVSSTQPTGSSLQAGTPSTQPAGPLLQAGTPSTQPTGSLLQANVPSVQPTRSLLQANVSSTQPTGSSLQAGTPSTQPTRSLLQASVPSSQTKGSLLQTSVPSTLPTGSLLQANIPSAQAKGTLVQANVPSTQPTGSLLQAGTPSAQPTGSTSTASSTVLAASSALVSQLKIGGVNVGDLLKLTPEALNDLVKNIAVAQLQAASAVPSIKSTAATSSPQLQRKVPTQTAVSQVPLRPSSPAAAPRPALTQPQPLSITLRDGSTIKLSHTPQPEKKKPGRPPLVLGRGAAQGGVSAAGTTPAATQAQTIGTHTMAPTTSLAPLSQKDTPSLIPTTTLPHSSGGLDSLAMAASLVSKAETSMDIDVGEPLRITSLPLPVHLQDHSYAVYNPEIPLPRGFMEINKSVTASHIPRDRLSYAPGVPIQPVTLQKMLKLSQKGKVLKESLEKKVTPKVPKQAVLKGRRKKVVTEEGSSSGDDADDNEDRRRSARNLGRRKKYVDDIDVNLSDYEETGDTDDEREKARKKKKYQLEEMSDPESGDEKAAMTALKYSQPETQVAPMEITTVDGLVQASVYYEPPEEEAQVVEKVLAHRVRPTKPEEKVYGEKIEEFLVKYKNFSYLHVEWCTYHKLIRGDKRIDQKIKRYKMKQEQLGPFAEIDEEPFNPDFTVAERVLDMATQEESNGEVVTHYLVKWKSLPYEESTWELLEDIDPMKVQAYHSLLDPPRSVLEFHQRPTPSDFRPIKESPAYKEGNQLRTYQLEGLNWLIFNWFTRQNCILADEMGLGKTVQSIAFLMAVKDAGIPGPFLVIAPLTTIANWQRELESWSDFNVVVYHGSLYSRNLIHEYEMYYRNTKGRIIPGAYKFNVIITTYEIILAPQCELRNIQWRVCVIDEAHRLKNRNCKLLEELKHINMEHRVLLTGTPLQNSVEELFSLLHFLEPTKFASGDAFLQEFGNLKTEEEVEKLKSILLPMMLRRLKEDVEKSLAPKEETIVEVELTGIQKQYYRAILEKNFTFLSKSGASGSSMPSLLNTMMELRKCCNHPFLIKGAEAKIVPDYTQSHDGGTVTDALIQSSGKMVLIAKLLPKLKANGHKVLIFSQMVRCLDILEDFLRACGYLYERIDGQVRGTLRQAAIDRFSKPDSDRFVFLLCTRAGGLGINLTAADTVIIYDSDWNPQNDIQAQSRCHRIGQNKTVKVYRLVTRNSYEREMFDRASMKLGLDRAVLQSMSAPKESAVPQMNKKMIEDLLKKGAYAAVMDEDDAGDRFCEEDIDQILERRTKVVQLETEEAGSTFAKARFVADGTAEDLDINDPAFWQKWAEKAQLDLEQLANKDNLIIDQPRQRRQTRRFGNNPSFVEEPEEEDTMELIPAKGKRGWTKLELQKVERYLLIFGWGQWARVLHSAFKGKKIRLSERDMENMCRTILVYCLHHFKGDEKARPFIHKLIDPSEPGPGKPDVATLHSNPFAFTEDDYLALMAKDSESLFQDEMYMKHLRKHANRIVLRVRQLHIIRWQILGDNLQGIRQGVPAKEIQVKLPAPEDPPPTSWWSPEADKSLLVGTIKHGYEQYDLMRSDPLLCFRSIVGSEPLTGRAAKNKLEGTPAKPAELLGEEEEGESEEDGLSLSEGEEPVELEMAPRKLPRMKRTPLKVPVGKGKQVWPTVADLNTRVRRLVSSFLKHQRQQQLKVEKQKKQQARREREWEASRQRQLKKEEMAQKWSRREEQDFARVVSFFGVVYDRTQQVYVWDRFRHLANLGKKSDERLTTYYFDFRDMCQRVINGQKLRKGKSGHVLERVTEDRASKCLQRIDVLSAIREEILPHPDFDQLITFCEASFEVPHWWIPVTHDVDLIAGVSRHGLARSEQLIYADQKLSFLQTVPKSALFSDPDKADDRSPDLSDGEERGLSDNVEPSGWSQEKDAGAPSSSQSLGVPIGWPKEKAIVMRLTRIVYAFRNGHWPKPMEGLDLFVPRKQDVAAMEEVEESSDEDELFNATGDLADHTLAYAEDDDEDDSGDEFYEVDMLEESGEDYPEEDSDSDFNVDVEEQSNQSWGSKGRPNRRQAAQRLSTAPGKSALGDVSFSVNKGNDLKLTIRRSVLSQQPETPPKSLMVKIPLIKLTFPSCSGLKKIPKLTKKRKAESSGASSAKRKQATAQPMDTI